MIKYQVGSMVEVQQSGTPFDGKRGKIVLPMMGDKRYALVELDVIIEGHRQWAVRRKHLVMLQECAA